MLILTPNEVTLAQSAEDKTAAIKSIAQSLMKVIALGAKHGQRLQFTAEDSDAELVLTSIGNAIESGLGEG